MTKKKNNDDIYCSKRGCGKIIDTTPLSGETAEYCIKCRSYFHPNCLDIKREKDSDFFSTKSYIAYCPNCGAKMG